MLTDNSLTFKHLGARLIFFTELLVRMLLYILLTTNCITLSSFLTNNLMRALWLFFICAFGGQTNVHVFFSDVGYCDHSICKITSPVLCNLIILHDIGIWNEQGKTMDPQLSTETLKNLTKDIYLCFSLYHKISVDDQFSNYHIYNNRKYSEITMMLHLNIESILKINCITPETNSLIYCININLPKTLPSDFFHNFS